jgi:hypothetical protein
MGRVKKSAKERSRELSSCSPPAPSRNENLSRSHEEIAALQHVGRVFLSIICEKIKEPHHGDIRWSRFEDDPFHAKSSTGIDGIKSFLKSRMASSRELLR